ncbi:MAG: flagellar biosynthesis protein FlhF [Gammaproteobacteria bacterium]
MNVSRFKAADMRQAIRQVKEELGPDAVILSSSSVADGIEIVAAIDYDESLLFHPANNDEPVTSEVEIQQSAITEAACEEVSDVAYLDESVKLEDRSQIKDCPTEDNSGPEIDEMRAEIIQMRSLLENQLAHFAWGEMKNQQPVKSELLGRLERLKIDQSIIKEIVSLTANSKTSEAAWQEATRYLCEKLSIVSNDVLAEGGAIALVGATGVGKTTSIAKLAARYILRYGQRNLALLTTDGYRIGAYDQLRTFGQILGVPVQIVNGKNDLTSSLQGLSDKRLVLIDTAGMSQRDTRLQTQIDSLTNSVVPVKTILVISATTQRAVVEQTIESFSNDALGGIIITKIDEASSLGELLSILIKKKLPVAFIGDGQRVPEDLHIARAQSLLEKALELSDYDDLPEDAVMAKHFVEESSYAAI